MEIQQGYSRVAKSLHWLIALLIFSEYFIGITLSTTGWKWLHFQVGSVIQ
jgi:cytochrome b561